MKKRIFSVICFLVLSTTIVFGEEATTLTETPITTELEATEPETADLEIREPETTDLEITDPEVIDRMREFALRFSGTREVSQELQQSINSSLSTMAMPIDIIINGKYLKTEVDALAINNRTYVPLRAVIGAFNFKDVEWFEDSYKTVVNAGDKKIQFLINTPKIIVNDEPMEMDTPSLIIDGRTMVPLRVISELLGFEVIWDSVYYTVTLKNDALQVNEDFLGDRFYTYDEMQTFAKLVMKEAGSVSYETKHGVASVVMNQVRAVNLENTIYGVIYDESRSKHFPPAYAPGFRDTIPNTESVLATKKALRGENSVGNCIFFNTSPFKGKTIYKEVDGVYFCY